MVDFTASISPSIECQAFVGLGSNLHQPIKQLNQALQALDNHPHIQLLASSPFYQSSPHGEIAQDDFINAVAAIKTRLAPEDLLTTLLAIETQQHRVRAERWGPRTLDLDLLLYEDIIIISETGSDLSLPHPRLSEREFVLQPLLDLEVLLGHPIALPVPPDHPNTLAQYLAVLPPYSLHCVQHGKNYPS